MKKRRRFYICLIVFLFSNVFFVSQILAKNKQNFGDFCTVKNDKSIYVTSKTPTEGGIREEISDKYLDRFERWKNEFLSTDFGRDEWNKYAENKFFVLIFKMNDEEGQGAGTSDYIWDDSGKLVGATIVLGSKIDRGYPDPIYFPVMNSLSLAVYSEKTNENILAAAKIAHEFGHVNQTAKTDGKLFRRQNKLINEYNDVLRKNNFNMKNPALADLEKKLGGTPVEIWENREYWGERNAMFFLVSRIEKEKFFCSVIDKIEDNIKTFAFDYEDRFSLIFQSSDECRE